MQTLLQSYKAQAVIFLFIWIVSMVLSAEFVLSVSMIALIVLALFQMEIEGPKIKISFRKNLRKNFAAFRRYKAWAWVSVPFLLVLVSALWSSDVDYTLERLRIKLPFLVLPFVFASMPALRRREILTILYFLLVMMFIISLYVCANFAMNYEAVMTDLGKGGHLPTPSNHIRFSLTLALTILGGLTLWLEKFHLRHSFERHLIAGMTVFLFLFIHLLSVRSGILALYLALFVVGAHYIFVKRKYLLGIIAVLLVLLLPVLAYFAVPSFKLKVNYARWDYLQYVQGIGGNYPDAERLVSIETGLDIGNRSPWVGIGAGDLDAAVREVYATELAGKYNFRMPHNQFVTVYAGTGLIGLAFFLTGFFYPLFYRKNFRQPLFLALHAIVFMSYLMENTIENNFGVSMYLFFLLMGMNFLAHTKTQ
jgi:O-antigen ligase